MKQTGTTLPTPAMLLQALARMTDEEPFVLRAEVRRGETGLHAASSAGCNKRRTARNMQHSTHRTKGRRGSMHDSPPACPPCAARRMPHRFLRAVRDAMLHIVRRMYGSRSYVTPGAPRVVLAGAQ